MSLLEIDISDNRWDTFVEHVKGYYAHYKKNYICAISNLDKEVPTLFFYEDTNGCAVSVFIKRDISYNSFFKGKIEEKTYYDMISPYGYGGYVCDGCNIQDVDREHRVYCNQNESIVGEVVKFHPLSQQVSVYGGSVTSPFHNVIREVSSNIDDIWINFKQKVRKNVKKANYLGLTVFHEHNTDHIDDFIRVYHRTMERTEASDSFFYGKDFFETICGDGQNAVFFYVLSNDVIVSVELVLYDADCCYSFLGGTDEQYFDMRPNDLIKYEIIKWANTNGLKWFILGGGHGSDDGIFRYKEALAPNGVVDFYIGTDLFNERAYEMLCRIRKEYDPGFDKSIRMFPAYRF